MAIQQPYGKKETFLVPTRNLKLLNLEHTRKSYEESFNLSENSSHLEMVSRWVMAMGSGLIEGRIYAKTTIRDYLFYVNRFLALFPAVSHHNLRMILMKTPAEQEATRQKLYKAILCFAKFLLDEGLLEEDEFKKIADKKMRPKCKKKPIKKTVTLEQIEAVLAACDNDSDRLLVMLLLKTGVRASEACALKRDDIFYNSKDLKNSYLLVRKGKGDKDRKVPIPRSLMKVMKRYYNDLPKAHKSSYLLWNNVGKPMDRGGLYQRIKRIGKAVNVELHPHALRRAFVTINHKLGVTLPSLQKLCGHSSIVVTRGYLMDTIEDALECVNLLD